VSWEAVTALSTVLTTAVILVTAIAAVAQLRLIRQQRRDAAAVELMRSLQDKDFIDGFRLLLALPAGISAADFRSRGAHYLDAAFIVSVRLEMLAVLVHRDTIAYDVAEDLGGGGILSMWLRLKDLTLAIREEQNYPMYSEWFQWLAEQNEKRDRLHQVPAYERHRAWVPKNGSR